MFGPYQQMLNVNVEIQVFCFSEDGEILLSKLILFFNCSDEGKVKLYLAFSDLKIPLNVNVKSCL